MNTVESTPEFVASVYKSMEAKLGVVRERVGKPLTLSDKILLSHLDDPAAGDLVSGESYLDIRPDRVAHQDVTGQMAILQFMQSGSDRVATPTTIHCDHLIKAQEGSRLDTAKALLENNEVYQFLQSASAKYGMGFWRPGAGIIHQVILENYAFPGGLMIGTDSHTPNASGLGMLAIGVGGAAGADVMAGLPWEVKYPERVGVRLTGKLRGWTAPKDVILYLAGLLSVSGGTNSVIEYFGPGARSISCTGKATITNMGAELGATGSIFPFDEHMDLYLRATGRAGLAELAERNMRLLEADPEAEEDPESYYHRVVEIDLSTLEPHVVGPHTPDRARPISKLAEEVRREGFVDKIAVALIGSCTNSSYEDMSRAADVANQAAARGAQAAVRLLVTPGSEQIRATIARDGQMSSLQSIRATVLANACGPCIGQWRRSAIRQREANTIVSSYNRNFPRRNDGHATTMNFIASPEIVVAMSLAGSLSFNPLSDTLTAADGSPYRLEAPKPAPPTPSRGFDKGADMYVPPSDSGADINIVINEDSQRLQILEPFEPWDGQDFVELPIVLKAKGKCTTDQISPAGPWLQFRGHLDNLSDNMFLGAINAHTGDVGLGFNEITGEKKQAFPKIARHYKEHGLRWVVIGDENYGEGSSREHAALSPRHLGAAAIIARSFARIHESNLKRQGVLALTFIDPADYDKALEGDMVSLKGLKDLAPGRPVECVFHHPDGSQETVSLEHSFNEAQIDWFRAGSALNLVRQGR